MSVLTYKEFPTSIRNGENAITLLEEPTETPMNIVVLEPLSDKAIAVLRALQTNCDRPRKIISHELDISESNLSKIIADLKVRGYIRKIAAVLDPKKLGVGNVQFFQVEFKNFATMERAEDALATRPEVQEIYGTNKGFELFIKVRGKTIADAAHFKFEIAGMEGAGYVHAIPTFHAVKSETDLPI